MRTGGSEFILSGDFVIEDLKNQYLALAARKRAEFERALENGEVEDPITILGVTIAVKAIAISAAVSVAVSAASYALSRAFAPKPPKLELGRLTGSLQLQNSEQGIFIPEIYGAGPAVSVVTGSNPSYQNNTNGVTGAGGAYTKTSGGTNWNCGISHNGAIAAGQDAFIEVTPNAGYAIFGFTTDASPTANADFLVGMQWDTDGAVRVDYNSALTQIPNVTTWALGDKFRMEIRSGRFRFFKNQAELTVPGFIQPTLAFPLYLGIACYTSGSGVSAAKVQIGNVGPPLNSGRGGVKIPAIIVYSSGIRKNVTTTQQPTGGGKGGHPSQTVENITYDIDLGLMFCRGPVDLLREYGNADVLIDQMDTSTLSTGAYDPTVGADPGYDPSLPPDPQANYILPIDRANNSIPLDGDGVGSGTIQGGGSLFAIYPGNDTQSPDPTIESDIDAKYGTGSTPAYRNHSLVVHKQFSLSRWSGIVPNMTAAWQHQTLITLDDIFASFCERVNVKDADGDYDFSLLSTITSRGMLLAGRLFTPAEVIGSQGIQLAYGYFATEAEGQIVAYPEGSEPSVTINDTEIGYLDNEADPPDIIPEVESILAAEFTLPKQVDVKFIDPDNDWEPNTQSSKRQITDGVGTDLLEVQLTMLKDEARAMASRKLYQDYVSGTVHKFTLPWTYLYLFPGYRVIINRAEGFTHTLRLTSINGGIGVLECEGVALVPEIYTQPAPEITGPGHQPVQLIPAMTIVMLLDTPLLRDGDDTDNNGVGFYMAGTPRTGLGQVWHGFALYISRNGVWSLVDSAGLPATVGTVVSVSGLNTNDSSVFDRSGVFTVDLYGTSASLSSLTETDLLQDATKNLALVGDMVIQFATATQLSGFPNRWQLSTLLNARRGTENHLSDTFTNKRFVLIDGAVKFVSAQLSDLDGTFSYRAVTAGQSLDDAATVSFVWTGAALKPLAPVNLRGTRDSDGNLLLEWTRRARIGAGMNPHSDVPLGEEIEQYDVESYSLSNVLLRTMRVYPGGAQAAILAPLLPSSASFITGNNLGEASPTEAVYASAAQQLTGSGSWVEATMSRASADNVGSFITLTQPPRVSQIPFLGHPASDYVFTFQRVGSDSGNQHFQIYQRDPTNVLPAILVYDSGSVGKPAFARIRIAISGTEVRFYWDYTGPSSVPFFVAPAAPMLPLVASFWTITTGGAIQRIFVGTSQNGPSTIYSDDQQKQDNANALLNPARVRVYQVSTIVGRGSYIQGDL